MLDILKIIAENLYGLEAAVVIIILIMSYLILHSKRGHRAGEKLGILVMGITCNTLVIAITIIEIWGTTCLK